MSASAAPSRPAAGRARWTPVEGADTLFTPDFVEYVIRLHDEFTPRVRALMAKRAEVLARALQQGILPGHPPSSDANTGDVEGAPGAGRAAQAGHRDLGPLLDHQHVHQCLESRARGRAGGG